MKTAADIARALIRCPSVTPQEGGALDRLSDIFRSAGFATERLRFSEPGWPDIENLYARMGEATPVLVFAGHTDVVPPGDRRLWRFDPFSAEKADGMIWGRGAVDMKGGLAACVAAALAFVDEGRFSGSIAFLVTGDEEGPAVNGTSKLLAWAKARGERFDHCLLAEPTSVEALGDTIKIGRRGSLSGSIIVHGTQGHVAYPHLAANPIPVLARLIDALLREPLDEGTVAFAASHLEFTSFDVGNSASNVIPAQARAAFNVRFNDRWTAATLADEISARVAREIGDMRYDLAFEPSNAAAFLTTPDRFLDILGEAIKRTTGRQPELSTSGGTSDARFIKEYCPVLEFGLPNRTMHAVDERVSVGDLEGLTSIILAMLRAYFA